jgi:hypothetical protein
VKYISSDALIKQKQQEKHKGKLDKKQSSVAPNVRDFLNHTVTAFLLCSTKFQLVFARWRIFSYFFIFFFFFFPIRLDVPNDRTVTLSGIIFVLSERESEKSRQPADCEGEATAEAPPTTATAPAQAAAETDRS